MDLNTIKFTVDTTELAKAKTALNELASAVDVINKAEKKLTGQNKDVAQSNKEVQKSTENTTKTFVKQTDVLKKNADVLSFMANGFTKGQASVLAIGKASGLTANQMKELEKVLDSIFKLAGKNPFDDSVDPIKRLRGEIEKTTNQIKVLKGETSLTAKQLNELSVAQARAEELAKQRGLRGAAVQSVVNKATREFMKLAEESNTLAREKIKLLDESTRKAQQEISAQRAAAKEQASALKEQVRLKELFNKTGRVVELRQEGFSTTSANQIIRAEKSGISGAELEAFRQKRKELDAISKSSLAAAVATNTYRTSVDGLQAAVRAFLPGFGALTGVAIGATAVAGIIKIADQFTGLNERLKLVTSSTQELVFVNERLRDIANDSRVPLAETIQLYTRLAPALKQYGGGVEATLGVTEAFGKALAISGANTKEAAAATLQFSQALGSGKLAGDEFRSIAEASPRLLKAIADGTGKTTGELKKLASEGFLTTAKVSQALISQLTVLELEFARTTPTISQAFTVFSNKGKAFIADLNEATGFTKAFAQGILSLADSIPSVSSVVQGASNFLKEYRKEIAFVAENLVALGIAYTTIKVGILTNTLLLGGLTAAKRIATSAAVTYAFALKAVELAGGGLVGTLKLLKDGFAALFAVITKNKIAIAIGLISAAVAFTFRDSLISQVDKMTEAFDRFFSKTEEGSEKFNLSKAREELKKLEEESLRLKRSLGKPDEEGEKSSSKNSREEIIKDTETQLALQYKQLQLREKEIKASLNLGKISKEQSEKDIKNAQAEFAGNSAVIGQIRKKREENQGLREEESKRITESKKEDESTRFTLGDVNKVFEQELSNANRLEQFQKAQIDANLQYRLISEAEAFVQREKLAKGSYERERSLIVAQIAKVQALQIDQNSKTKDSQIEQKNAEQAKLKLKLTQLDVDRKQVEEMAKIAFLGKENERSLEAENKLSRINADIQQDIQALLEQQANQYKDPAVVAAEQARIRAADKYTEQIARLVAVEKELKEQADRTEDNETWISINEQLDRAVKRTEDARDTQKQYSDEVAKTVRNIAEQNRTLEAGFNRYFAELRNGINDLSKVSEEFTRGFFRAFDEAFTDILTSGKLSFSKLFKYIREEIKKLAINKLFLEPIKVFLEPVFRDAVGGIFGSISGAGAVSGASTSGTALREIANTDLGKALTSFKSTVIGEGRVGQSIDFLAGKVGSALSTVQGSLNSFITNTLTNSQNATLSRAGAYLNEQYFKRSLSSSYGFPSSSPTTVASAGAGIVGSFAGAKISDKLSNGYETKGFVGFANSLIPSIASAIGSAFGPIGAIVGGAIGGVISAGINQLFGSKTVLGQSGIQGSFSAQGFEGQAFQDVTIKRRLRGDKSFTNFAEISEQALELLAKGVDQVTDSARTAGRALQTDLNPFIDSFEVSGRFSSNLNTALTEFGDRLVEGIIGVSFTNEIDRTSFTTFVNSLKEDGENLLQAFGKVSAAVVSLNEVSVLLGKGAQFNLQNAQEAFEVFQTFGSSFSSLGSVLEKYLPAAEFANRQTQQLLLSVQTLGLSGKITAETTREQFASLLNAIDLTSESGARELNTLLSIEPILSAVIQRREQESAAVLQQANALLELQNAIEQQTLSERIKLEEELFNLTASQAQVLEKQRNALFESNRELFDQIQLVKEQQSEQERLTSVLEQRLSLEEELFNLTASQAQVLEKQRNAVDESNKSLFDQIQLVKEQQAEQQRLLEIQQKISQERLSLEDELFNLTASPTEMLNKQREALDESNRSLFDQIQLIKKKKELEEQAIRDVTEAYNKERNTIAEVRDKLKGFAQTLAEYRNQLLSSSGALSGEQQLNLARSRFDITVQSLSSQDSAIRDQAFSDFTRVSDEFLTASRDFSSSYLNYLNDFAAVSAVLSQSESKLLDEISVQEKQLLAIDKMVEGIISVDNSVRSLSETLALYFTGSSAIASLGASSGSVVPLLSSPEIAQVSSTNTIMQSQLELLNSKVQQLIEESRINAQQIALNTAKTARVLERADDGDALNVRVLVD